jgi:hypothetical protein
MKEIAICNGVSFRANAGGETGQPVETFLCSKEEAKAAVCRKIKPYGRRNKLLFVFGVM